MAGRRISGSRMPPLRLVARAETQSERGPAVARPIIAPTRTAKLVKPKKEISAIIVDHRESSYLCFGCSRGMVERRRLASVSG